MLRGIWPASGRLGVFAEGDQGPGKLTKGLLADDPAGIVGSGAHIRRKLLLVDLYHLVPG